MFYQSPSGNTILKESLSFTYEQSVYVIYPDRVELYLDKLLNYQTPLKQKYISKYIKKGNNLFLVNIEWIGAPKDFLIKNKFTILNNEEYISSIKESRKNYKNK